MKYAKRDLSERFRLVFLFFITTLFISNLSAQTEFIAHKSHSGNDADFSLEETENTKNSLP